MPLSTANILAPEVSDWSVVIHIPKLVRYSSRRADVLSVLFKKQIKMCEVKTRRPGRNECNNRCKTYEAIGLRHENITDLLTTSRQVLTGNNRVKLKRGNKFREENYVHSRRPNATEREQ